MDMTIMWIIGGLTIVGSTGATRLLLLWKHKIPAIDVPNQRSSHHQPKPRTGGMAIALAWTLGAGLVVLAGGTLVAHDPSTMWIVAGAFGFLALGVVEDLKRLSVKTRLAWQLGISSVVACWGPRLSMVDLPWGSTWEFPSLIAVTLTSVWCTGFANFFNFMDGVDAIAAGEAVVVGGFMWWWTGYPAALLVSCAALGFLAYNRQPSRIFMGDGGSYFLGYVLAAIAVTGSRGGVESVPFVAYIILMGTFIVDPTVTLLRRIFVGEPWMEAHRSHYYQKGTDLGWSHAQISWLNASVTAGLGYVGWQYGRSSGSARMIMVGVWLLGFVGLFAWMHRLERLRATGRST